MRFCRSTSVLTAVVASLSACSSPTDVDALGVSLRPLSYEEWLQWPSTLTIAGGEALVVRGRAFVGCGRPDAIVQRRATVVGVEIRAVHTDAPCMAVIPSWAPFEATVTGLAPGTYRIRVGVVGFDKRTEGTATIAPP